MEVPLELSFRGIDKTDEIETLIREKVNKLEQFCDYMTSCRIAVEAPQQHQQTGSPFQVRIEMHVPPGHDLVVKRESSEGELHEQLSRVLRGAFDAASRQLKKLVDQQQGEVKHHPEQETVGFITRLFPEEGYGFLRTEDGVEIYFHRNSVLDDDFDRLEMGTGVRYVMEAGEEGPQASTVQIVDKSPE